MANCLFFLSLLTVFFGEEKYGSDWLTCLIYVWGIVIVRTG